MNVAPEVEAQENLVERVVLLTILPLNSLLTGRNTGNLRRTPCLTSASPSQSRHYFWLANKRPEARSLISEKLVSG
jgi:hypothetical protein